MTSVMFTVYLLTALTDIAVGKPATQSSTFETNVADHAVDGDRGTDLIENTCSHTDIKDFNPWWRVDLQAVYYIIKVRILNRGLDMYLVGNTKWMVWLFKLYNYYEYFNQKIRIVSRMSEKIIRWKIKSLTIT